MNPRNESALAAVIRGHYQLATAKADPNTGTFSADARTDLVAAADAWQRYLATKPAKPDLGLARVMVQTYSGLAQGVPQDRQAAQRYWGGAASTTETIAAAQPTPSNYVALVQFASLAGQTNKADLAAKKAVQLAPKSQRKAIQQQVASAKAAGTQKAGAGTSAAPTTTGP